MNPAHIRELLAHHLPSVTVEYCFRLWEEKPFQLRVTKKRISKSGDFTCRQGQHPRITINQDLHPLEFLITYIHEVAHYRVHQTHGFRAEAHGSEWKIAFQNLLTPVLLPEVFPEAVLPVLQRHMFNPKASTYSDPELTQALRSQDPRTRHITLLSDLPEGSTFDLNGRWFKKGKLQRTRVLCLEVKSKRKFLVPADAAIGHAQLSLLF